MDKLLPDDLGFAPRSIIMVIKPHSKVILTFNRSGRAFQCILPPAYANERALANEVLGYINDFLKPFGFSAAEAMLPQKLLAVRCGLARYGRNNISYSKEFGSYMQLLTFFSDMPCDTDEWRPIELMEVCQSCKACMAACPTGAIHSGHHIIDAIKCITASNELPGEFPEWLDKSAHNSIVGCMKCQDCCPANAHNKNNVKMGVEFSEEETAELLGHKEGLPLSDKLASKLEAAGIWKLINVLPRNLAILLPD
ncbi:MAG: 4Fe-4S binding protein [Clostridiales bacterium]|nr:4Fe-4S binding protein [Clostridiales bacterium]